MGREGLDQAFSHIVEEAGKRVAALGFRRRGVTLQVMGQGCVGLIEFQRSTTSSSERILFTINLAVAYGALLEVDQPSLEKIRSPEAHLRVRIGMLMPDRPDKWWEIKDGVDIHGLADEVATLVATEAAPYVMRYLSRHELTSLWQSGQSPGLTETQRVRYLERLSSNGEP
jgi:hypothetical protein